MRVLPSPHDRGQALMIAPMRAAKALYCCRMLVNRARAMLGIRVPRKLLIMIALQAIGAALMFASILVITGVLGPAAYGRYAFVVSAGGILALLLQRGLPTTILKSFAPLDLASPAALPVARSVSLFLLASIVSFAGAAAFGSMIEGMERAELVWALPIGCGLAAIAVADAILRAADRGLSSNFMREFTRPLVILSGAVWFAVIGIGVPEFYLAAYALSTILAVVLFMWRLPVMAWRGRSGAAAAIAADPAHFHVSISRTTAAWLPIFISGLLLPPEEVAYLALALQLTAPIKFGIQATFSYSGAKMAERIKDGRIKDARLLLERAAVFSIGIAALAAFGIAALLFFLEWLQLGPAASFDNKELLVTIFIIVGLGQSGYAVFGPVQMAAILLNEERSVLRITVSSTLFLLIGLAVAGGFGSILAAAVVMPLYTFALGYNLRNRAAHAFKNRLAGELS